MEFGLLGPLTVVSGAEEFVLGGPRQRTVLAHLLLHAEHGVTQDRLIDELWGNRPPATARGSIQAYVSRLRAALGPDRLEGHGGRYVLHAVDDEVDVRRFHTLCSLARTVEISHTQTACEVLRSALDLWRGSALEDVADQPSLAAAIARLDEERLATTEEWIDTELALGHGDRVVPELTELIALHPFRERLWGQHMLALYCSGRQGEALEVFQRLRVMLRDELGVEPWPELERLRCRMLWHDPALDGVGRSWPVPVT